MPLNENMPKGAKYPHLAESWMNTLRNSGLDPCPDAAAEIDGLRAEVKELQRKVDLVMAHDSNLIDHLERHSE